MGKVVELAHKRGAKYLIVRVPVEVPVRDEDGHVVFYSDTDTITEQQLLCDKDGFPVLDDEGNEQFEDVEVPAPFGAVKTETKWRAYRVPLAGSMTVADLNAFRAASKDEGNDFAMLDFFVGYFGKHVPKSVIESMSRDDVQTLITAWDEASGAGGVSQGE